MKPTWKGIVKVQRSISTNAPVMQTLIYNRSRTVQHQGDMTPELLRWFRPGELKFYAEAELRNTIIHILKKVPSRPW